MSTDDTDRNPVPPEEVEDSERRSFMQGMLMGGLVLSHATKDDGFFSGLFDSSSDDASGPGFFEDMVVQNEGEYVITDPEIWDFRGGAVEASRPNDHDEKVAVDVAGDIAVKGEDIEPSSVDTGPVTADSVDADQATITDEAHGPRGDQTASLTEAGGHSTPFEPRIDYYAVPRAAREIVFVDGSEWFAVDASNNVYRSTDKGTNWTQKGSLPAAVNNAFIKLASGTLIAVCGNQTVQRSTDNGSTWTQVDTLGPTDGTVLQNGLEETSSGYVLYAEYTNTDGENVRIRRSTDDGQTWSTVLTATASSTSTTHFHCLQYDPHAATETYVAFGHGDTDAVWISTDEGATWPEYTVDRSQGDVNPVDFAFFKDYVAWAYDLTSNNGWFARIHRDNWPDGVADQSNYEWIGKGATHKAFYHAYRVSDDLWVYNADARDRRAGNNEGDNYHHELWAMWDNGSRFTHLDTVAASDTKLADTKQAMTRLPAQGRGSKDHDLAVSFDTQGSGWVLTPSSVTYGGDTQKLQSHLIDAQLPNNVPLRALDSSGSPTPVLKLDPFGNVVVENRSGATAGAHEIRDNGLHDFEVGGTTIMTFAAAGALLMNGHLDLRDSTTYSDTNDSMTANPETDTESGYFEIQVGGTTKQVPFYDP